MQTLAAQILLRIPTRDQTPLPPQHTLNLFSRAYTYGKEFFSRSNADDNKCHACGRHEMRFFFSCFECPFELDIVCASLTLATNSEDHEHHTIQHLGQNHPLIICDMKNKFNHSCSVCLQPFENSMMIYVCLECRILLHKSCFKLPVEIKRHYLHPEYLFTLSTQSTFIKSLGYIACRVLRVLEEEWSLTCKTEDTKLETSTDVIKENIEEGLSSNILETDLEVSKLESYIGASEKEGVKENIDEVVRDAMKAGEEAKLEIDAGTSENVASRQINVEENSYVLEKGMEGKRAEIDTSMGETLGDRSDEEIEMVGREVERQNAELGTKPEIGIDALIVDMEKAELESDATTSEEVVRAAENYPALVELDEEITMLREKVVKNHIGNFGLVELDEKIEVIRAKVEAHRSNLEMVLQNFEALEEDRAKVFNAQYKVSPATTSRQHHLTIVGKIKNVFHACSVCSKPI